MVPFRFSLKNVKLVYQGHCFGVGGREMYQVTVLSQSDQVLAFADRNMAKN